MVGSRVIVEKGEKEKNDVCGREATVIGSTTIRQTEEIAWSSSARKLSESRAHNYKHPARRASCFQSTRLFRMRHQ